MTISIIYTVSIWTYVLLAELVVIVVYCAYKHAVARRAIREHQYHVNRGKRLMAIFEANPGISLLDLQERGESRVYDASARGRGVDA